MAGLAAGSASAVDMSSAPSVNFYGLLDYGYLNRQGNSGGVTTQGSSTNSFESGISAGSRLGVKGSKDINSNVKFLYELEYGVTIDNNGKGSNSTSTNSSSTFWNRHSYIGATGTWGTALGGRLEGARYTFSNTYDPFAGGTVGNFGSLIGNQARADNAVLYASPVFAGGFDVIVAYTTNLNGQENYANMGDARLYAIAPQYNNGPLSITYDYEDATVHSLPGILHTPGDGGDIKINVLGASYDLGVVKLFGYYENVKDSGADLITAIGNLQQKAYLVGATAPIGESIKLKFSYGDVKDDFNANSDCKKTSLGADYKLDKNFSLYADFATISNQSAATCTIATTSDQYSGSHAVFAGVDSTNAGNKTGYGTRGFDFGAKFTF